MAIFFYDPSYARPKSPCSVSPLLFIGLHVLFLPGLLLFAARLLVTVAAIGMFATGVCALFEFFPKRACPISTTTRCPAAAAFREMFCANHTTSPSASSTDTYTIAVAVPGIKNSDLSVTTTEGKLHIQGETKVVERVYKIDKTIMLPDDADADMADAKHDNGLLTLSVPRKPPAVRPIPIQTTAKDTQTAASTTTASAAASIEGNVIASAEATDKELVDRWDGEWDTLLDDLSEMGFDDRNSGRAALAKHSGSIKKAVKELVAARAGSPPLQDAPQPQH